MRINLDTFKSKDSLFTNIEKLPRNDKIIISGTIRENKGGEDAKIITHIMEVYDKSEQGTAEKPSQIIHSQKINGKIGLEIVIGVIKSNKINFDNAYIHCIKKTDEHSGTENVLFAIKMLKTFNCKNVYLNDYASVYCNNSFETYSLSLYKLLTKGYSWYEQFGFKPSDTSPKIIERDYDSTIVKYRETLNKIKNFPISSLEKELIKMINSVLICLTSFSANKISFRDRVTIFRDFSLDKTNEDYEDSKLKTAYYIFMITNEMLRILSSFKKKNDTVSLFLSRLIKINCGAYCTFIDNLTDNNLYFWRNYEDNNPFVFTVGKEHLSITISTYIKSISNIGRLHVLNLS
jgi:hypothetical protein